MYEEEVNRGECRDKKGKMFYEMVLDEVLMGALVAQAGSPAIHYVRFLEASPKEIYFSGDVFL